LTLKYWQRQDNWWILYLSISELLVVNWRWRRGFCLFFRYFILNFLHLNVYVCGRLLLGRFCDFMQMKIFMFC